MIPSANLLLVFCLNAACMFLALSKSKGKDLFGSTEENQTALMGIFYDMKQTQAREKTHMDDRRFWEEVGRFIGNGWDEAVFDQYFRATRPLYATQLFIPSMKADAAPEAFGVGELVAPRHWLAHYKGQVSAPESGNWRFWGLGDDVLCVAVNGKTVLISNWANRDLPGVAWKSPEPAGQKFGNASLRAGDWISLEAGDIVDLDVILAEVPGSLFACYLLIEKQGEKYEMIDGHPILPVFRLSDKKVAEPTKEMVAPIVAPDGPIWLAAP